MVVPLKGHVGDASDIIVLFQIKAVDMDQGAVSNLIASLTIVGLGLRQILYLLFGKDPLGTNVDPVLEGLLVVLAGTQLNRAKLGIEGGQGCLCFREVLGNLGM